MDKCHSNRLAGFILRFKLVDSVRTYSMCTFISKEFTFVMHTYVYLFFFFVSFAIRWHPSGFCPVCFIDAFKKNEKYWIACNRVDWSILYSKMNFLFLNLFSFFLFQIYSGIFVIEDWFDALKKYSISLIEKKLKKNSANIWNKKLKNSKMWSLP